MSTKRAGSCLFLAAFCVISWRHSLIDFATALHWALVAFLLLSVFMILLHIWARLRRDRPSLCSVYSPVERRRGEEEQARRNQQQEHSLKASDFAERILKPRRDAAAYQRVWRQFRLTGESWKLSPGSPVGGGEALIRDEGSDGTPNQESRRRRKLVQPDTPGPVLQEPKQKEVVVLPEEPSRDTEGLVRVTLRCPGGRTVQRSFLKSWSSELLLNWMKKTGYHSSIYQLCMSYPRAVVPAAPGFTLEECGILTDTLLNVEEKEFSSS